MITKGLSDVLDRATSSKLGIDAIKKLPGEGFKRNGAKEDRCAAW